MPRLAVLFVLSAASSPCPDLNLIHYIWVWRADVWRLWFVGFGGEPVRVGMAAVFQAVECGRFQGRARGCVGGTAVEVVAV
ncbi:hypothetical protein NEIMUCOT_05384 [Neisseria mucosa ATCC 25996]|uniref:Uncharacterized protein n=1 Tax=Neisseria mucosa (strain ATCC 25996 / DSM 4631 / NCTC 10774 / M26) TaxID=546266 RepID=D2ZXN0_NEIM2|nr:hypothetical protein NEIMUCOT_05384 [Neisseria mucosa ATCC 25996]